MSIPVRFRLALATAGIIVFAAGFASNHDTPRKERLTPEVNTRTEPQGPADEVAFYPVGNQAVRRLVFFDRRTNTVYEYGTGGDLKNTWVLNKLGEQLEKK
jgi:hypothetical protein